MSTDPRPTPRFSAIQPMKPTDIRIDDVRFAYEDFRYRTPIKFGGVALDRATLLNVDVTVRDRRPARRPRASARCRWATSGRFRRGS